MTATHFKDWTALSEADRQDAWRRCRAIAQSLQGDLAAFLDIAERCDAAPDGPLSGLPYAAKDMFQAPGRRLTWGLGGPAPDVPETPKADVLDRLDRAGARRVGFTRMTALAYEPSGINPLQGAAVNPWNPDVVPGASSSGSAVAVASGAAFIALGSDTGGSLRIPAQGCGLTAWKPTWGAVPDAGAMPLAPSLDTIGLLARSARDLRLVAPVIADGLTSEGRGPRKIAVPGDALDKSEPSVREACRSALDIFDNAGVHLQTGEGLGLIDAAGDEAMTVMQAEAAHAHAARIDDPAFDPTLSRRLAKGREIDAETLGASLERRQALRQAFENNVLSNADMIALPVMPIRTPLVRETDPASPGFSPRTLYAMSAFTRFANYLGLPALALPAGFDDRGMPVALQLIGPAGSDMALIDAGVMMQERSIWHGRLPATLEPSREIYGDLLV